MDAELLVSKYPMGGDCAHYCSVIRMHPPGLAVFIA